ncbi:hypothetical protein J2125_004043 [Erwinia toletana]|uniref:Uncharacterized protein n=1 Tax=Winslowiella toletana TaxID=92490 RepID=A0ABS4PDZ4_9GAMM|nr:hypothetical protein [Winslowiella toletana]MBP2170851.1 hypothetical protein [Winslowiella toletana]
MIYQPERAATDMTALCSLTVLLPATRRWRVPDAQPAAWLLCFLIPLTNATERRFTLRYGRQSDSQYLSNPPYLAIRELTQ